MNSLQKKSQLFKRVFASAALITGLISVLVPSAAQAQVSLPNGTVDAAAVDLRVKVLGGWIAIDRQWWEGQWHINERWAPIQLTGAATDSGGCLSYPEVSKQLRTYSGDGLAWSADKRFTIRASDYFTGSDCQANRIRQLRWQDRSGNWMEYERLDAQTLQFRLARYGDKNNISVSLIYNNAGQLSQVKDHNGTAVLQYLYNGSNQLSEIRDLPNAQDNSPSRSVKYTWGSNTVNGQPTPVITKVTDVLGYDTTYAISNGRIDSITDPEGRIQRYTYITDRVASYTDALGYKTSYSYDYDKLKKEFYASSTGPGTDANPGPVTDTWYDVEGALVRRDIAGQTTYRRAQQDSRVETRADGLGRKTTITQDEYGNIVQIVNPDGSQKSSKYSAVHGQITEETDELGIKTQYDYDGKGNLTKKTEALSLPEQRITEYQYDNNGNLSKVTVPSATFQLPNGQSYTQPASVTQYDYDSYGNLIQAMDPLANATRIQRDRSGNATQITDAKTNVWEQTFDLMGRIKTKKTPLGAITRYSYDKVGNQTSLINQMGKEWKTQYDANNQPTQKTNPLNQSTSNEYDAQGQLVIQRDALGQVMQRMSSDAQSRPTESIDAAGNITKLTWDDSVETRGPIKLEALGLVRLFTYDMNGHITRQEDAAQINSQSVKLTTSRVYDPRGLLIESTDKRGNKTTASYDALVRQSQTTDAQVGLTRYTYDSADRLIAVTDAKSSTTAYTYDAAGRLIQEARPLGQILQYEYDALSNLTKSTDPKGNSISWIYDASGRRTQEVHRLPNQSIVRTITYTWNDADQMTGYTDSNTGHAHHIANSAIYTLDDLGRKTDETLSYGGATYTQGNAYTATGRKTNQRYADGQTITYAWDAADRLQSIQYPEGAAFSITGRWWNLPTSMLYPGGTTETLAWDGFARQSTQQVKNAGQASLLQRTLQYDAESNPTRIDTEVGTHQYTYDPLNRLTQATHPGGLPTEGFTLDAVGNRIVDLTKPNPQNGGQWQYNANHQLTQAATENTAFMSSNSQPIDHSWDSAGNLTQKNTPNGTEAQFPTSNQRYVYDAQNRLTETQDNQGNPIASYQYDPYGRRIRKTIYREWSSGWQALVEARTSTYLYIDEGLSAEYRQVGNQAIELVATHGWQPEGQWGTSPLWTRTQRSDTQQVERFHHHTDHLGTPLKSTDALGNVVWSQKATAFGETMVDPASLIENPFRFPGQYYDKETNTNYNYFRDYDPTVGRYVQRDPIGLRGGWNTYGYVGGGPLRYFDPLGLSPICNWSAILDVIRKVSETESSKVVFTDAGFEFVPKGISIGPNLDPKSPRQLPLAPGLNFEIWWSTRESLEITTTKRTKVIHVLQHRCVDTVDGGCEGKKEVVTFPITNETISDTTETSMRREVRKKKRLLLWSQ